LEGYQKYFDILKKIGVSVVAASVDDFDSAKEVANGECFPRTGIKKSYAIGYGVSKELSNTLGSYWKVADANENSYMQPAEFLVERLSGEIVLLCYSDGGLGRIDARDVVGIVASRENIKNEVPHVWPWGIEQPIYKEF